MPNFLYLTIHEFARAIVRERVWEREKAAEVAACARMRFATKVAVWDGIESRETETKGRIRGKGRRKRYLLLVEESGFENANSLQPSFRLFVRIREIQDFRWRGKGEGKERERKVSDESAHGIVPDIHGERSRWKRRHRRRMRDREERDNETVLYYVPGDGSSLSLFILSFHQSMFLSVYILYIHR